MNNNKQRWIVKAGSSLVAGGDNGINESFIENLVSQVDYLLQQDIEVIVVSSGAVAKGMHELNLRERPSTLHLLQASAAVGQMGLINTYQKEFDKYNLKAAQVLISHDDIANRKRYLNAKRSLETLLELKVVPIVNENDCVATEEISFGDNDTLAGALSGLVSADYFIMLTDQEGICTGDPSKDASAVLIPKIDIDDSSIDLSTQLEGSSGVLGRGGMKTKIKASRIALDSGCKTWVVDGRNNSTLKDIANGKAVGTSIISQRSQLQSRKTWIASLGLPSGNIILDGGAVSAVCLNGKSLLAVGIKSVAGSFERGDLIICEDREGKEVARGLTNFSSSEINLIKGLNSSQLLENLDHAVDEEVIHRNNLIVT
jgi:glutamate 5-kinase